LQAFEQFDAQRSRVKCAMTEPNNLPARPFLYCFSFHSAPSKHKYTHNELLKQSQISGIASFHSSVYALRVKHTSCQR
jgi:hypothetical protein